ncbi:MAG: toxin Bro [Dorea sp.]|nr:toxin Bro [Dorea sp.]
MNDIKIFNNPDFGEIRTVVIDNEPWFVGRDVCKALGYADIKAGARKNVDDEDKRVRPVDTPSGNQNMTIINESGLYSLIFGSKLESAKKFKKWVTKEVLPTIRKTGQYGQIRLPMTIPEQIQCIAQGHVELKAEIDSVKKDLEDFKNDMPILGVEESKITNAVKRKGVECLGGKESNAYKDKSLRGRLYSDLHKQLRREFGVSTYKAIKRNQANTAIALIRCYAPPLVLSETIETVNSQQILDV